MTISIITAGRTGPNKALRFGGDASVDAVGRRDIAALAGELGQIEVICGPETATVESAALLDATSQIDAALQTLDVGAWDGLAPEEIDVSALREFFTDPASCPHGGESIATFVDRIMKWYSESRELIGAAHLVVAMPVAQALIAGDPAAFLAVQVAPGRRYRAPHR